MSQPYSDITAQHLEGSQAAQILPFEQPRLTDVSAGSAGGLGGWGPSVLTLKNIWAACHPFAPK